MDLTTAEAFLTEVSKTFPNGIKAVSFEDDFDFYALIKSSTVEVKDGAITLLLFPETNKNFYLRVTKIEEESDQWVVHTDQGKWAWRPTNPDTGKLFVKLMKEDGWNG